MVPQLSPDVLLPEYRKHKSSTSSLQYPAPSKPFIDGSGRGMEHFPAAIITHGPSDKLCLKSAVNFFLSTPLTDAQKNTLKRERSREAGKTLTVEQLMLTSEQLSINQYPNQTDFPDWSRPNEHREEHYEFLALDCEMASSL